MGAECPRNDKIFTRSAGQNRVGGEIGEAPPAADDASRFRGSAPIGGCGSGRESAGTTGGQESPAPTHNMWAFAAGDRKGRPYGGTRGAGWRADVGIGPYGAQQRGGGAGRRGRRPLRSAARGQWSGSSRTPAPTGRSKGAVERVDVGIGPYGCRIRGRVRWGRKKGPRKRSLKI